jgi:K+-transporting ATPase c subunit
MNTTTRRWLIISVIALAAVAAMVNQYPRQAALQPVSCEEETAAAEALLAAKLSGPRYFSPQVVVALEDHGRWIWIDDACSQVPRIVAERKLGPAGEHDVRQLIVKLSEPHPYRMVGGQRVNLLRLNLSLDALP